MYQQEILRRDEKLLKVRSKNQSRAHVWGTTAPELVDGIS